jgi:hypothetical protein
LRGYVFPCHVYLSQRYKCWHYEWDLK